MKTKEHFKTLIIKVGIKNIINFFICLFSFGTLSAQQSENVSSDVGSLPNIIFILSDDQGYGDLGSYGSKTIKTPNIDQLAVEGVKFTDFYVHPICSPTRAAFLTGCYAPRAGFPDVQLWGSPFGLNPDEVTIAEILKTKNYKTACIGKWHLGNEDVFAPNQQGFDYFYGIRLVNGTQKFENFAVPLYRNDSLLTMRPDHSKMTRDFTEESLFFIEKNKKKSFFLYLAYTMPHIPIYPGESFRGKSGNGLYADAIEEIDWSVGRIVEKLKAEGLEENTLIVFTSDNGPWAGHGEQSGSAGKLKGSKLTTWEGGIRVPMIMKWKNVIPASKVYNEITGIIDMAPTIAAAAGASMPDDRVIDGKNLFPYILDQENTKIPHEIYYHYAGTWLQAVRSGKWKLHFARPKVRPGRYGESADWITNYAGIFKKDLLYNLETDIGETKNLVNEFPEIVQELKSMTMKAKEDIGDYSIQGKNSRPIGSTYLELTDITQYPNSKYARKVGKEMMTEMLAFQKKRFNKLSKSNKPLNNQEAEELEFYIKIFTNEKNK
ncbi:MAG: arylsulfatase [Flavobacteriaceae bacterium]|nr:arylsulfatase [Flavobacteriaceae bacterium]|tara:strand:+ start:20994 stop:22634 length:1641 start_codon:yes stop_codon:yes gene_type:complete